MKWPDVYGEDNFVLMMGGLHIEMVVLKIIGDWLRGSGWVEALVQADITSAGVCDSFLNAAHITRTRRAPEVTACALYILQYRAYQHYQNIKQFKGKSSVEFAVWRDQQIRSFPQFQYWDIVMKLDVCLSLSVP